MPLLYFFSGEETSVEDNLPDNTGNTPEADGGDVMNEPGSDTSPAGGKENNTQAVDQEADVVVTYTDEDFFPQTVNVNTGDEVVFVNESSQGMWMTSAVHPTHEVYSGTSLNEHCNNGDDAFDVCTAVNPGEEWSFVFDKTGEWGYHNHVNVGYTGTVVVNQ